LKEFKETVVKALLPQIILTQAANREIHGWELIGYIKKRFGIYLGPSTIYPALNDLEKQGFLKSEWIYPITVHPRSPKPPTPLLRPRKIYTLTNKGKIQLAQGSTVLTLVNRMIEVKA
jgi:DNA-binding PadR family transcriptional regulator